MARKSSVEKTAEKAVKKVHAATIALALLFFVIGCIGGVVVYGQLTKNDKFDLLGDNTVTLKIGEAYTEAGVSIVSFGRDISDKVVYGGDYDVLDTNVEGVYQIVYKVEDIRWGDYQRVRTVIVGDPDGADGNQPGTESGAEE